MNGGPVELVSWTIRYTALFVPAPQTTPALRRSCLQTSDSAEASQAGAHWNPARENTAFDATALLRDRLKTAQSRILRKAVKKNLCKDEVSSILLYEEVCTTPEDLRVISCVPAGLMLT